MSVARATLCAMSDENPIPDASPPSLAHPPVYDYHLHVLSNFAQDNPGFSVSVTLDVQGVVISGELVGRNDWFDELDRRYGETAGAVTKALKELGQWEEDEDSDEPEREDYWIHIKDAHRDSVTARPAEFDGMMWRGKIASIDGWSIGYRSLNG